MADYNSAYTGVQIDANLALAATAVQDADLATVATTGAYTDLTGKPTLGTAAATASTDYATAAQGTLAGTAVQPGANANVLGSGSATDNFVLTANGSGGVAWEAAAGGGGTPGGSDTQVQFNDGGAFGGDSGFTFDKTNNTLGLGGGTITASDPIIDMAQTWNNGAVAFTAIKSNVTDTASAAGSLLMDLQVGGVSKFNVEKTANIGFFGTANSGTMKLLSSANYGITFAAGSNAILFAANNAFGGGTAVVGIDGIKVGATSYFAWTANADRADATADLIIRRDAANTLAQRNGVNAQAFNLYNTYTDASNYERGFMRFVSNTLRIGTEKLGTGTARALEFQTNGLTRFDITADGSVRGLTGFFYNNSGAFTSVWALFGGLNNYIGMESNHGFSLRTNNINRISMDTVGSVQITTALTVATLPATPLVGMMARVTNATTPTVGSTVAGGGAANAMCWYNGTNWTVIGV